MHHGSHFLEVTFLEVLFGSPFSGSPFLEVLFLEVLFLEVLFLEVLFLQLSFLLIVCVNCHLVRFFLWVSAQLHDQNVLSSHLRGSFLLSESSTLHILLLSTARSVHQWASSRTLQVRLLVVQPLTTSLRNPCTHRDGHQHHLLHCHKYSCHDNRHQTSTVTHIVRKCSRSDPPIFTWTNNAKVLKLSKKKIKIDIDLKSYSSRL